MTHVQRNELSTLSDRELIAETRRLAEHERDATAAVVGPDGNGRAEAVSGRRLLVAVYVLHTGAPLLGARSLRPYRGGGAARRFPAILDGLVDGRLTLTAIGLLAAHLTPANWEEVLSAAEHRSKREVEHIVAAMRPQPAVPAVVRKLPSPRTAAAPAWPAVEAQGGSIATGGDPAPEEGAMSSPPAGQLLASVAPAVPRRDRIVVTPLAPERYKVQLTISREAHDALRRAQDLLRHAIPDGNPAVIFERALTLLVGDLERTKLAAAKRPRAAVTQKARSRHVPAVVKREVGPRPGALRLRRHDWRWYGARIPRDASRYSVRRWRRDGRVESPASVYRAQRLRSRGMVRADGRQGGTRVLRRNSVRTS